MKVNTSVLILAVFAWSFAVMETMTAGIGVMRRTVRKWVETVAGESSGEPNVMRRLSVFYAILAIFDQFFTLYINTV